MKTLDTTAFPLAARERIKIAAAKGAVITGFFYRDNNASGSYDPGEETSATLLGLPRIDGLDAEPCAFWNCYRFEGLERDAHYTIVYDVDGVEPYHLQVCTADPVTIVHVPVRPTKQLVYVIAHSHFDPEWMKTYEEYLNDEIPHMLKRFVVMREDHAHGFNLDEECALRPLLERHPELIPELKQGIADGMIEPKAIVAGGDLTMPLGESLIRQITVGEEVLSRMLGMQVSPESFWNVDNYGFCPQLPQLLLKSGRRYLVIGQYHWYQPDVYRRDGVDHYHEPEWREEDPRYTNDILFADPRLAEHPEFFLEGPDGSRILAHRSPYHRLTADAIAGPCASHNSRMNLYGGDFAPPDVGLTGRMTAINRRNLGHKYIMASTPQFFRAIEGARDIPTFPSESWMGIWTGSYESRVRGRQRSRECEYALIAAESLAATDALAGRPVDGKDAFREAWYLLLINHHHDPQMTIMAPGLFDEVLARYDDVTRMTLPLLRANVCECVATNGQPGDPIIVSNPLPWHVTRTVEVPGKGTAGVLDCNGKPVPAQVTEEGLVFLAEQLPPAGWRTYYVGAEDEAGQACACVTATETFLDNGHVRVELEDGLIRSVAAAGGMPQLKADSYFVGEVLIYEDEGCICRVLPGDFMESARLAGRSSDVSRRVRVVEKGPLRGVVETAFELDWGTFTQRVALEAEASHVGFETTVDWRPGPASGRRVRVVFPTTLRSPRAFCDSPFAVTPRERGHAIRPVNAWMSLDGDEGSAALVHAGTCSIQAADDTLWMTLFRSVRASGSREDRGVVCWDVDGDEALEEGGNTFRYWLCPGTRGWEEARMPRLAIELSIPFPVAAAARRDGSLLSECWSILVEPEEIVMSALMPTAVQGELLLRLFNPGPRRVSGTVSVRNGATQAVEFAPYEIRNLTIPFATGDSCRRDGRADLISRSR